MDLMNRSSPRWLEFAALALLATKWSAEAACASRFYGLPSIRVSQTAYVVPTSSRQDFCRLKGFEKAGRFREATLDNLDGKATALNLTSFQTCNRASCMFLLVIECVPEGADKCEYDARGNLGNHNVGYRNVGRGNQGISNFGTDNRGNHLWGNRNIGEMVIGNDLEGNHRKPPSNGNLLTSESLRLALPNPVPPQPPAIPGNPAIDALSCTTTASDRGQTMSCTVVVTTPVIGRTMYFDCSSGGGLVRAEAVERTQSYLVTFEDILVVNAETAVAVAYMVDGVEFRSWPVPVLLKESATSQSQESVRAVVIGG